MKDATSNAATKIANKLGNESIIVLGIVWHDGGNEILYADKEVTGATVKTKILELGDINNVLDINRSTESFSVDVVLNDTDGEIKAIMDQYDIHKRKATIYQCFKGLDFADRIVLFKGVINSPIYWREGDRTVSFSILSLLEEKEIGFSPDQASLDYVDEEAIGQSWPMVFGAALNVPGVKVKEAPTGALKDPIAYPDQTLYIKRLEIINRIKTLDAEAKFFLSFSNAVIDYAPSAKDVLDQYLAYIILEDNQFPYLAFLGNQNKKLQDLKNKQKTKAKKDAIQAKIDSLNFIILNFPALIGDVKKQVKDIINDIKFEQQMRQQFKEDGTNAMNQIGDLIVMLVELEQAIADQESFFKTSFRIGNADKFPQGTLVDIQINGLRLAGTFSGEIFTLAQPPKPLYTNVAIGPRQSNQADALWITDPSLSLQDQLLAVTIRKTFTNPDGSTFTQDFPAVVKVVEQIGTKIVIELKEKSTTDYGPPPSSPGNIPAKDISDYSKNILLTYNASLPLSDEEFNNIRELEALIPTDKSGLGFSVLHIAAVKKYEFIAAEIVAIHETAPVALSHWLPALGANYIEALPETEVWFSDVGSEVRLADDVRVSYVSSITPGAAASVKAYRVVDNKKQLVTVPPSYYTPFAVNLPGVDGNPGINAIGITLKKPLSSFSGEQWEDQPYIDTTSTVGPNTVDILEYLIQTYAPDYLIDTASFNDVRAKISGYPSYFAIFEQKNLIEALREIAWQARCAIWLKNDTFYIKYLSEEPTAVATITESDVEAGSLEVFSNPSEEVITKLIASWRPEYSKSEPLRWTLRHNIKKYGVQSHEFNFYIYTNADLVEKSATFWLIRYSNVWKHVRFKTFLTNLRLEPFDCILLDFDAPYIANEPVKVIVEKADYSSSDKFIEIEAWVPVKAGSTAVYDLFWPSSVDINREFPTEEEIIEGSAGSGPPISGVSGSIGGGSGSIGGGSVGSGRPRDYGRRFPSDSADLGGIPNPVANIGSLQELLKKQNKLKPFNLPRNNRGRHEVEQKPLPVAEFDRIKIGTIVSIFEVDPRDFHGSTIACTIVTTDGSNIVGFSDPNLNKTFNINDRCIAIYNKALNRYEVLIVENYTWLKVVKVIGNPIDDFIIVEDIDENRFNVAKPTALQPSVYNGANINFVWYYDIDSRLRIASNFEPEDFDNPELPNKTILWLETIKPNYYDVGETLIIGQLETPIITNADDIEELDQQIADILDTIESLNEDLKSYFQRMKDLEIDVVILQGIVDREKIVNPEDLDNDSIANFDLDVKKLELQHTKDNINSVQSRIYQLYDKIDELEAQKNYEAIFWIDLNTGGKNWQIIDKYQAKLTEDIITTKGLEVEVELLDYHFNGTPLKMKAKLLDLWEEKQIWYEGDRVIVSVFEKRESNYIQEDLRGYVELQITDHFPKASYITFTLISELARNTDEVEVIVTSFSHGYDPSDENGRLKVFNTMCYEGEQGKEGQAVFNAHRGRYEITAIACCDSEGGSSS